MNEENAMILSDCCSVPEASEPKRSINTEEQKSLPAGMENFQ